MNKSKKNGTNFLVQGSILAMASIISRIIGLIYRIPLTDIIGDVGNNYYGCAYEVYNIMLIISSYSLPIVVSKLVSVQMAKKHRRMTYQVLKCSLLFALCSGLIVALIVFFGADFFAGTLLKTPNSVFALRILAPALLIVALLGVLRGFFQGLGTMIPSAVSQVLEQIVNAVVSVWAAYVLFQQGTRVGAVLGDTEHYAAAYGAAGGTLGSTLGALAALLFVGFVFFVYMKVFRRQMKREPENNVESFWSTMHVLILTIIPVLLSTTIYNIVLIIDQGLFKNIANLQGYKESEIDVWWGVFSGKYRLMTNVPISIASAIAASSVPALTVSFRKKDTEGVKRQLHAANRFLMIIAFPSAVGLAVLAPAIFTLLFPSTIDSLDLASMMMYIGSCAVVFTSLSTLSNGLLQGIDRLKVPVMNSIISLIAHLILLFVLMMFFRLNIYAVVIANTFFVFMVCVLNGRAIAKYSGYRQEWVKTFFIPAGCSAIMGVAAFFLYHGMYQLTESNTVSLLIAILAAILIYGILMLLLKGLTEEELSRLPKGQLLIKAAKKVHLLR